MNDDAFLAPESMLQAIRESCEKKGCAVPETVGQTAAVIYQSLAESYAQTVAEIEELTGRHFPRHQHCGRRLQCGLSEPAYCG